MIDYLKIKNYQIHEDLEVEFKPNLNVFVGASDTGKSAALRALLWVFTNRPLGEDYRTWDSKETKVEVGIDGRKIIRCKSDTENYYQIDKKRLDAPGTEVPKEIVELINISDVNIQRQGDSYFLISSSSGEVGKYINQIIGLEVMDGSIKYASQKAKALNLSVKTDKVNLKQTKTELVKLNWVDKADKDLQEIEDMQVLLGKQQTECNKLSSLIDDYEKYTNELDSYKYLTEARKEVNTLIGLYNSYQSKMQMKERFANLVDEYNFTTDDLEDCVQVLKYKPKVDSLLKLIEQYNEKKLLRNKLYGLISDHNGLLTEKKQIIKDKQRLEQEFHQLMPDICPLCGK